MLDLTIEVPLTGIAFLFGFGTPRGFMLPLKVVELMPLMDNQPRVSQYRPGAKLVSDYSVSTAEIVYLPDSNAVDVSS